jgi:hypothetical protein
MPKMSTPNKARRGGLWVGGAVLVALLGSAVPALAAGSAPVVHAPSAVVAGPAQAPSAAKAQPSRDLAKLKQLVKALGDEAHGKVKVTGALGDEPGEGPGATAEVRTRAGAFTINAWLEYDYPDGVADGIEGCRLDNEYGDRDCRALVEQDDLGIWERAFPNQAGRRELNGSAGTKAGGTLMLLITNYTEQPSGEKVVGPTWRQAGITVSEVRAALAATGLTVR